MQVPLANVDFNGEDFVVGLGVLISWQETMGVVEAVCLQGCACDRQQFSTFFSHSGWSMTFWRFLRAKVDMLTPPRPILKDECQEGS